MPFDYKQDCLGIDNDEGLEARANNQYPSSPSAATSIGRNDLPVAGTSYFLCFFAGRPAALEPAATRGRFRCPEN